MTLSGIGFLALAVIGVWTFGGIALRIAGAVIALAGLLDVGLSGRAIGLVVFALGVFLWLAGHWHFRLRHGTAKSALVEWLARRPGSRRI